MGDLLDDKAGRAVRAAGGLSSDAYLAALKRELAGYVADGRADRVAQVRAEIARITGDESIAVSDDLETAVARPARTRRVARSDD